MRETWYILTDGNVANPADIVSDAKGALFHKNGVAVAMRGDVPSTKGVDLDALPEVVAPKVTREVVADKPAKRTYKTRTA